MDFFEAAKRRRSVRKYTETKVPEAVVQKAIDAALIAPNSSNMQTWRIFWVRSAEGRKQLIRACLDQGAARTSAELLVFVADPSVWKTAQRALLEHHKHDNRPDIISYYGKLMPFLYGWRILAPFKWLMFNVGGIFKPMPRKPWSSRDIEETCIKSAALACENFMLAIAAQGFDTCPMEGFDEWRVKRLLGLGWRARVVMVISVGERDPRGVWGEQYRLPQSKIVKQV